MSTWGGARKGAGRPRGPQVHPSRRAEAKALGLLPATPLQPSRLENGLTPLEMLLSAMRDERLSVEVRLAAAKAVAPYFHAKVSIGPPKSAREMSDFELAAAIEREREYQVTGRDPGPLLVEHADD